MPAMKATKGWREFSRARAPTRRPKRRDTEVSKPAFSRTAAPPPLKRESDGGAEPARDVAEFIHSIDRKAAQLRVVAGFARGRRIGNRVQRSDGFAEVAGEGVDTELELDDAGRRAFGRAAHLEAQTLNGGANFGGIFRNERQLLAIYFESVDLDVTGDLLKGFGRDAGDFREAEVRVAELSILLDEVIRMAPAEAGIVGAELFPGEAEVIEHAGVADVFEALSAGRGAT